MALGLAVVALVVALLRQHTETVLWRGRLSTTQAAGEAELSKAKAEAERLRQELDRARETAVKAAAEAERRKQQKLGDPESDWLSDRVPCNQGDLLGPGRSGDGGTE